MSSVMGSSSKPYFLRVRGDALDILSFVASFSGRRGYLTPEEAICDDEVDGGEDDANDPPD